MPSTYADIFEKRGRDYHDAMLRFPGAREEEFLNLLALADIRDGQIVCDYPAGGGYLQEYITQKIDLILLEPSPVFFECAQEHARARCLRVQNDKMPVRQNGADRFLSLAGLRYIPGKHALFTDIYHCLKLGGVFAMADVHEGSAAASFLNDFVYNHSEERRKGLFLNSHTRDELEEVGFNVTYAQAISYPWKFTAMSDMVEFCRLHFGITGATAREIETAIRQYLGVREYKGQYHLGWESLFLVAEK